MLREHHDLDRLWPASVDPPAAGLGGDGNRAPDATAVAGGGTCRGFPNREDGKAKG